MIDPEDRLWVGQGIVFAGGPYSWNVTDFDQRRTFLVTYENKSVEDPEATEEVCVAKLRMHVDHLSKSVFGISFSDPDGPITISTDRKDDVTYFTNYQPLPALGLPFPVKTISVASLTELDRLGPQVDLVSYQGAPDSGTPPAQTTAAFKYWFVENGMFRKWLELGSWSRLPRHPHIVPFDSVVLESTGGGVIGFTSIFIPGGTLRDNNATTRPFRLAWLRQLLSVIDDLNYRYGIMHQDVAPRNLLIDGDSNLRIFDFNYSIMIGEHYTPERDDTRGVIFTLYEVITLDEHFRNVHPEEQDVDAVLRLKWTKHPAVQLDSDVQTFRDVLDTWVKERNTKEFKPAETWIRWPPMPPPPAVPVPNPQGEGVEWISTPIRARKGLVEMGLSFWDWERPASYRMEDVGNDTMRTMKQAEPSKPDVAQCDESDEQNP